MCFMVGNGSQLTGPCVHLPYKSPFESQLSALRMWGSFWGSNTGIVSLHQPEVYFFFRETMWESEEEAEQAPTIPLLWESEASCRLHSPLGQTRDHSPVCKPPILQDIGNLEQETTVTHTLTSLSLTPCSLGWGTERLQNTETVLPAQVCAKHHTPDDHRSGEGMLHFNIFTRHSFSS